MSSDHERCQNAGMRTRLRSSSSAPALLALGLVALLSLLASCAGSGTRGDAPVPAAAGPATSAEALQRLVEGNERFAAGRSQHPRQTPDTRADLAAGQRPFAVIVSCSDSRVGPEVIFDQGLGDLFVVRVAGNVVDDHALGSVEYAAEHLHAPLVVVLGHSRCGAVAAARDTVASGGQAEGHVQSLVEAIRPAVEATAGQDAEATCRANVQHVVATLRASQPLLAHLVEGGALQVVGATYDLDTGHVTVLGER